MRVQAVFRRADFQPSSGASEADADRFFAAVAPGADGLIARDHAGMAIAGINPNLALQLGATSRLMALDLEFAKRADLRELAIQIAHLRCGSGFGFESRLAACRAAGLDNDQIATLALWRTSALFSEDQRLVMEYADAAFDRAIGDDLLARFVAAFGEKGAIECAAIVGFWTCWAIIIDVARP